LYRSKRSLRLGLAQLTFALGPLSFVAVNRSHFIPNSRVVSNGFPVVNTYVNSNQLLAETSTFDIAIAGTALVFVFNPSNNNAYIFGFTVNSGCGGELKRGFVHNKGLSSGKRALHLAVDR
jgi:hypothetical protein